MSDIAAFFNPKGVAIIGASAKPNKLSYGIVENLARYGYKGAIYPINPNAETILGLKCYDDVRDVPDPVELGVIVLPAGMTVEALRGVCRAQDQGGDHHLRWIQRDRRKWAAVGGDVPADRQGEWDADHWTQLRGHNGYVQRAGFYVHQRHAGEGSDRVCFPIGGGVRRCG